MEVTWDEVSSRLGRNELPATLIMYWSRLRKQDKIKAVHEAWTMAEWPEMILGRENWVRLFDESGFGRNGEEASKETLPEIVTLYRGSTVALRAGMAWTTDLEVARWFAGRFTGMDGTLPTHVWKIEIPRDALKGPLKPIWGLRSPSGP